MKTYIISYDLLKPGQNYSSLHEAIKNLSGYWAKPLESFWLVDSNDTAAIIRNKLSAHIDQNDKLFITSVGSSWASWNIDHEVCDWLNENWSADQIAA